VGLLKVDDQLEHRPEASRTNVRTNGNGESEETRWSGFKSLCPHYYSIQTKAERRNELQWSSM